MFTAESGWTTFVCGFRPVQGKHDLVYAALRSQWGSSDNVLQGLGDRLATLVVAKHAIGWELEQVEEATETAVCTTSDSDDESTE